MAILKNTGFFVLGILLWWFVAGVVLGAFGSSRENLIFGVGLIIFFGSLYAVPVTLYLAAADVYASQFSRPVMVFVIVALAGIAILTAIQFFGLRVLRLSSYPYIPTLAVVGLYFLKQILAQRK